MKKRLNNHLIILIVIIFLASYLRLTNLTQPIWPDEALYAKTAENLYNGEGLTFDGTPWRHQPPLFVLFITLSYIILGVSEASTRIVGPLFGILGIIAVYYLGKQLYNEKVGIIAAFFLGVTPVHWFLSRMILTDIALTTLITLTILFFYISTEKEGKYAWATGVLIALVGLTKRVGPIIYLILISYLITTERNINWIKKKEYQTIFGISFLLQIPWLAIKSGTLRRSSTLYTGYIAELSIPSHQGVFTVLKALPYTVSKPVLLLALLGIFYMVKKVKKEDILVITPIIVFLLVYMLWGGTRIEAPRYLIPIVPFFCIISANAIHNFSERIEKRSVNIFFIILVVFLTLSVNAIQGDEMISIEWERYSGYEEVSRWIDQSTTQDSIIITNSRIIRYYSNRNIIYYPPDKTSFQKLLGQTTNNTYIVIDSNNRVSPDYITDYINTHSDLVFKVSTFNIGQNSKIWIYTLHKIR